MARNIEKNAHYPVSIPRGSLAHQQLLRDAQESGLSVQKIIALRIVDYYSGRGCATTSPLQGSEVMPDKLLDQIEEELNEEEQAAKQAKENAASALDAWI